LPLVKVSKPVHKSVEEYEDFTGVTQAKQMVEVRARASGYLAKAYFKEGALVQKDEVLFDIDPRTYQADLARMEANVVQSEAHLARLKLDYRRVQELFDRGGSSREELDRMSGDLLEAEAAVRSAKAGRDLTKLNLGFCKVTAPFGGRISRRLLDPGNMVKADETPLTTLVSIDPIYVYFDIDDANMLRLRRLVQEKKIKALWEPNMPVQLGLADETDFPHAGIVDFVDNQVDAGTGTLRMRGVFPNLDGTLAPGLFVRIHLPIGTRHEALLVAEEALGRDQGQKYVLRVNPKNQVDYCPVTVGRQYGRLRELTEGLSAKDRIIVSGLQRVRVQKDRLDPNLPDVETEEVPMPGTETTATPGPITKAH
jgi:RND family efflux transporter MFP subunit